MFRISTKQIISKCQSAIKHYHDYNYHYSFLFSPGQDKINLKMEFLLILSSLTNSSPEQAIFAIYKFCKKEGPGGLRDLVDCVESALFDIFEVEEQDYSFSDVYEANRKAAEEKARRLSVLENRINTFLGQDQKYINKITSVIKMHNTL